MQMQVQELPKIKEMEEARKDDFGKPKYALLPWDALEEVAKVFTYGATKYKV